MTTKSKQPNVKQAVPFLGVSNMEASLRYYVDGLGFEMTHQWMPHNKIEWCCLQLGNASLMLQEFRKDGHHDWTPEGRLGAGVSICFICEDALTVYHEVTAHGIEASEPFVGNNMWVTSLKDPDGYQLHFESITDVPEETKYSDWKK
jgi:lactoylglutathione lyase